VFGFKCFLLDAGVEEFQPLGPAELESYLAELRTFDALMIVHAEDSDTIERAPEPHGGRYADFLASRPRGAENTAIAQVIDAARTTGARAHIGRLVVRADRVGAETPCFVHRDVRVAGKSRACDADLDAASSGRPRHRR
jgi:dihydroorotase-like cyclic amidohydrolase